MLYIWMPEANGVWRWSEGEFWKQSTSLDQMIQDLQLFQGKDAVVFFPSNYIQLIQQPLAKSQYKKLGPEGVKYLLEEFVILPLDHMKVLHHFEQPDLLTVMGIANTTSEMMQHSLALLPVKIQALLPDFLLLPVPEVHQTVIVNFDGRLLIRENEFAGQAVDDLALFLDFGAHRADQKYLISNLSAEQMQSIDAALTQDQVESIHYVVPEIKRVKQHPFNILPKAKNNTGLSGYWKACAAILLGLLVVQFSYDAVRWYQNKKVANVVAAQAVDQFKYWFGQGYPVTEQTLKSQFEAQLRQSETGNTQSLQLLSRIGPILMQHQIVANRVSYEASILTMELKANSAQALQQLTQQLNQQGFKVELGNIQPQDSGAVGLVKIQ